MKSDRLLEIAVVSFLSGALLSRGLGLAQKYLWSDFETETPIFEVLLFDIGVSESYALSVDNTGTWSYLTAAIIALIAGLGPAFRRFPVGQYITSAALLFCVLWEMLMVLATLQRGGLFLVGWTPATHALRIATPLVLFVLVNRRPCISGWLGSSAAGPQRDQWGLAALDPSHPDPSLPPHDLETDARQVNGHIARDRIVPACVLPILRIAVAATFIGHGVEAICLNPHYITLLVASMSSLFGSSMSQLLAERLLCCIGVIDVVLAILMLTARLRWVAFYMAAWGGITALSRMTAGGWVWWPEVLLRASHFVGPLVVLLYWSAQDQAGKTIVSLDWETTDEPLANRQSK